MEQTATGSAKPPYSSKLHELLTSDRSTRRSDLAPTTSATVTATTSGNSLATNDNSEKGKKPKLKADASNGSSTGGCGTNQGPASIKVAPIVLKKCYPSAVQSADSEEFLVSVSEDNPNAERRGKAKASYKKKKADVEESDPNDPIFSKYKDEREYMGAQIDKLLSTPSHITKHWKIKPFPKPRHPPRTYQCEECDKSYSSEEDLQSHSIDHLPPSEREGKTLFACDRCGKSFRWIGSLRHHKQKEHRVKYIYNHAEGSVAIEVPPPDEVNNVKVNADAVNKPIPTNPGVSQPDTAQSFESVVNKMVSSGLVTTVAAPVEKSLPTRRQCSNAKDVPAVRRSTLRKERKTKSTNDVNKKAATPPTPTVTEETDESVSPQTPTTGGRSALRRNIQRPKWLSDADLVTDYEFPRGTNAVRIGSAASSPSASTSASLTNGNQSQSRTASTDSRPDDPVLPANAGTPKSLKLDKNKPCPPSSRDRKRKEETNKSEPKKKEKSLQKPKDKPEKGNKNMRSANKPRRNSRRNAQDESESLSPTKNSSTKISILRLEDAANQKPSDKLSPEKTTRKRPGSESPASGKAKDNKKSKKESSVDMEEKHHQSNGINEKDVGNMDVTETETNATDPIRSKMNHDNQLSSVNIFDIMGVIIEEKLTDGGVETVNNSPNPLFDDTTPQETQSIPGFENKSDDKIAPSKPEDEEKNELITLDIVGAIQTRPQHIDNESDSAQVKEVNLKIDETIQQVSTDAPITVDGENLNISNDSVDHQSLTKEDISEDSSDILPKSVNNSFQEIEATDSDPYLNVTVNTTFSDMASNCATPQNSQESETTQRIEDVPTTAAEAENKVSEEVNHTESEVGGHPESNAVPAVGGNDEEMPILRPEASSSAAGSRSDSFAERMQSIDEDVSSSSNHSTLPQAPVLSKEATGAAASCSFANGLVKVRQGSKTNFTESTVADNHEALSLVDEEEAEGDNARMLRDRSDSLSMRSFGSGSQSEKIKALDETASKEKPTLPDHDCLVDSDSNDSLMSEFSELAAQLSEKTDGIKFKKEVLRFITTKVSCNSMWAIRKELKRLKKDKNYFKFGKLSPLAAGLMHDLFCQSLGQ